MALPLATSLGRYNQSWNQSVSCSVSVSTDIISTSASASSARQRYQRQRLRLRRLSLGGCPSSSAGLPLIRRMTLSAGCVPGQ